MCWSGPLCLERWVEQLSARNAKKTLTVPLVLQGNTCICGTFIPEKNKRTQRVSTLSAFIQSAKTSSVCDYFVPF